jgi:molybdopterin converting factor subunit 1
MITIGIKYFAALREQAGTAGEQRDTPACTAGELYAALQKEYGFTLSAAQIKVAVNEEYRTLDHVLVAGDDVVFIPPVSGG